LRWHGKEEQPGLHNVSNRKEYFPRHKNRKGVIQIRKKEKEKEKEKVKVIGRQLLEKWVLRYCAQ
jgi:hypothetical protein